MSQNNATASPIVAQPYRLPVVFFNTSDKVVTGWTGASSVVSSTDGASTSVGPTPVEIGQSGLGWMDFTGDQMNTPALIVRASITNASAQDFSAAVFTSPVPVSMPVLLPQSVLQELDAILAAASAPGMATLDAPTLLMIQRLYDRLIGKAKVDDGSKFRILDDDLTTVLAQADVSFKGGVNFMGKLVYPEDGQ